MVDLGSLTSYVLSVRLTILAFFIIYVLGSNKRTYKVNLLLFIKLDLTVCYRYRYSVLTSSNDKRVETTSKTLQLNKARIFCSTILLIFVAIKPASAITPIVMIGNNASDTAAKAEKACSFFFK